MKKSNERAGRPSAALRTSQRYEKLAAFSGADHRIFELRFVSEMIGAVSAGAACCAPTEYW
jgi:hypothetical protein